MNCWLNIYKPRGISSARAVGIVKRLFPGVKIGHTGTLDPEAEGVLPLALGEATKLVSILIDATKTYCFKIKFGSKTDTGDSEGRVVAVANYIPTESESIAACAKFIGKITQQPPIYSALKVDGVRAYKLARENKEVKLAPRQITIHDLKLLNYIRENGTAEYEVTCSKGTYVRTLAEDISLYLQTLGFVIELRRTRVGIFDQENAADISDYIAKRVNDNAVNKAGNFGELSEVDALPAITADPKLLLQKCLKMEEVLADIPVLAADQEIAQKIRFGQICYFPGQTDADLMWLKHQGKILAIGSLLDSRFKSSRVFNC